MVVAHCSIVTSALNMERLVRIGGVVRPLHSLFLFCILLIPKWYLTIRYVEWSAASFSMLLSPDGWKSMLDMKLRRCHGGVCHYFCILFVVPAGTTGRHGRVLFQNTRPTRTQRTWFSFQVWGFRWFLRLQDKLQHQTLTPSPRETDWTVCMKFILNTQPLFIGVWWS